MIIFSNENIKWSEMYNINNYLASLKHSLHNTHLQTKSEKQHARNQRKMCPAVDPFALKSQVIKRVLSSLSFYNKLVP